MHHSGWMVRIACGIALLAWIPSIARPVEIPPLRPAWPPDFTADLVVSLDENGRPAIAVSVAVAYNNLQWIRLASPHPSGRHAAGIEIAVSFVPRSPGSVRGDVWERRLVVASFQATRAARAFLIERRSFDLPPGRYRAIVRVRDLNAEIESSAEQVIAIPDYSKVPVGFADLELGVVDSSGSFRPKETRSYGVDVHWLAARARLFDRREGAWPREYRFGYRIVDDVGAEMIEGDTHVTMKRSAEPVIIRPTQSDLFVGRYAFEVALTEGKSRWRVDRTFDVEESGPPRGPALERLLEPLSYISRPEEIRGIREADSTRQLARWEEFWARRDPTPDTPRNEALIEFIRRVRHAERHFQGYGPGWRSDMGRIYIRYGPPDQVENRAAGSDTPQLEIWYYHNPVRTFVFGDREGFGRYTLMSPLGE